MMGRWQADGCEGLRAMQATRALMSLAMLMLLIVVPQNALAQGPAAQDTTPLSFRYTYQLAQGNQPLASYQGTGVNLQYSAQLTYGEDLILTTQSTTKYAQAGASGTLTVSESNDIALIQLTGNAAVTFSFLGVTTGSINYPIDIEYAVPVSSSNYQAVTLGTYSVANAQVGPVNVQVNMQPVVNWTPQVSGQYSIEGPASVSPGSMSLSGGTSTATISFTDNQPTDLFIESPLLTLQSLSVSLVFPVIISGFQVSAPAVTVVNVGTYFTSSPSARLISFDPNYYLLFSQLQGTVSGLQTSIQQLQSSFSSLSSSFNQLQSSFNSVSSEMSALSNTVTNLSSSYGPLKSQVSSLTDDYGQLRQSFENLTSSFNQAVSLLQHEISSLGIPQATTTSAASSTSSSRTSSLTEATNFALNLGLGAVIGVAVTFLVIRRRP